MKTKVFIMFVMAAAVAYACASDRQERGQADLSPFNSVLGHDEETSIVGNFSGDTLERLTVVSRFKVEYIDEEPYAEYYLDGKKVSEEYYLGEAQYLWRVESGSGRLPGLEVSGCHPCLVIEGDLDRNGTEEIGILDTWLTGGKREYSIYTFRDGAWRLLIDPIVTAGSLRASGQELARPGPRPGTISVTMSDFSALNACGSWAPDIDTVFTVNY